MEIQSTSQREWRKQRGTHNVACVISGYVAEALDDRGRRILPIGDETVKGISAPIPIYEYRLKDECVPVR